MQKLPVILCALFLAGLGTVGAFQQTGTEVESVSAEREKAALCAAVESPEASAATTAPMPTEAHFGLAASTQVTVSERPVEPPKVDTSTGTGTLQVLNDTNGLAVETDNKLKTEAPAITPTPVATSAPVPQSDDPYHTDVYPNNVYSKELIYDADGNLIGKTTTYPTVFGPDTIWIDGRAYYNLPGFGLIEWSGPSRRTEDYTMYESGVKISIMGGDNEAPASSMPADHPTEFSIPTEETINQTINVRPERNSTPPDYKPDTTPPDDPNARDIG